MGDKIKENKERKKTSGAVFLYALVLAFLLFNFGVFLGYKLENYRVNLISGLYVLSELESFDVKIQSDIFDLGEINCDSLVIENLKFADRVFAESLLLSKYDDAKRISEGIKLQHKRYDLLRTLMWVNSIKISKKCTNSPHRVVYIYKYNEPDFETIAKQDVFSRALKDLKEEFKDKIILIPMAGDNNVTSLSMLMNEYNITKLPTIIINEKTKITDAEKIKDVKQYLK